MAVIYRLVESKVSSTSSRHRRLDVKYEYKYDDDTKSPSLPFFGDNTSTIIHLPSNHFSCFHHEELSYPCKIRQDDRSTTAPCHIDDSYCQYSCHSTITMTATPPRHDVMSTPQLGSKPFRLADIQRLIHIAYRYSYTIAAAAATAPPSSLPS